MALDLHIRSKRSQEQLKAGTTEIRIGTEALRGSGLLLPTPQTWFALIGVQRRFDQGGMLHEFLIT